MTEQTAPTTAPDEPRHRPHVRWGAIVWGLIVVLTGVSVLAVLSDRSRSAAFADWLGALTIGGLVVIAVITLGALLVIGAFLAIVRRAQQRARA
jgi:hypothetical protein